MLLKQGKRAVILLCKLLKPRKKDSVMEISFPIPNSNTHFVGDENCPPAQIDYVEFEMHVAGRSNMQYFDLLIRLKIEQEYLFRNIQRNEYHNLFDYIRSQYQRMTLLFLMGLVIKSL